ncbi:MAG: hypothetical protein AB1443_13100 [Pseudomonadota bacterium]
MKIATSDLALRSDHVAKQHQHSTESLRAWRGPRPDFEGQRSGTPSISPAARQAWARETAVPPAPTSATCGEAQAIESACEAAENDPFIVLIKRMLELLTGEEIRTIDLDDFAASIRRVETQSSTTELAATSSGQAGWGVEYDYHATYEEFEQTTFSAAGTIRTADGQEISFTLDLQMTRSYREETNVSVRAGDAVRKDPLVVNFDGTAAQLAGLNGRHFKFDLDGDGKQETLPLFASGSGYLALDLNGNGKIDAGRELFGPGTGNGFEELARLDEDGNGWIDESDSSYDRLSVWTPAAEDNGSLKSLAELGIGALGLAHVASPFALRGSDNADLGVVKASGVYLTEAGQAGSLQEIDLTV